MNNNSITELFSEIDVMLARLHKKLKARGLNYNNIPIDIRINTVLDK